MKLLHYRLIKGKFYILLLEKDGEFIIYRGFPNNLKRGNCEFERYLDDTINRKGVIYFKRFVTKYHIENIESIESNLYRKKMYIFTEKFFKIWMMEIDGFTKSQLDGETKKIIRDYKLKRLLDEGV